MKELVVLLSFAVAISLVIAARFAIDRVVDSNPDIPPVGEILEHEDAPDEIDEYDSHQSGKWPTVRKYHLQSHPVCEACGRDHNRNVHHIVPFHAAPALELDPSNLITLCAGDDQDNSDGDEWSDHNCHFRIGHDPDGPMGPRRPNWKLSNPAVESDARTYRDSLSLAP